MGVFAATGLEAAAARRELRAVPVYETGIALRRCDGAGVDVAISCGLAGGLRDDVPSGSVLIPNEVRAEDGSVRSCDPELVRRLAQGARSIGFEPFAQPVLTAGTIVRGAQRARWAQRGCIGVDMESALLRSTSIAVVRVVLDTPIRELSADWERPLTALLRPWNWPQAVWLARVAPGYARRAAAIVRAALAGR